MDDRAYNATISQEKGHICAGGFGVEPKHFQSALLHKRALDALVPFIKSESPTRCAIVGVLYKEALSSPRLLRQMYAAYQKGQLAQLIRKLEIDYMHALQAASVELAQIERHGLTPEQVTLLLKMRATCLRFPPVKYDFIAGAADQLASHVSQRLKAGEQGILVGLALEVHRDTKHIIVINGLVCRSGDLADYYEVIDGGVARHVKASDVNHLFCHVSVREGFVDRDQLGKPTIPVRYYAGLLGSRRNRTPLLAAALLTSLGLTSSAKLRRRYDQVCQNEPPGQHKDARLHFLAHVAGLPDNEYVDRQSLFGEALTLLEIDSGFSFLNPEKIPPFAYEAILTAAQQGLITRSRARRSLQIIGCIFGTENSVWTLYRFMHPTDRPLDIARALYAIEQAQSQPSSDMQATVVDTESRARTLHARIVGHIVGYSPVMHDGLDRVWLGLWGESDLALREFLQEEVADHVELWPSHPGRVTRGHERALLVGLDRHLTTAKRAYQQFTLAKDVMDNEFHPEWHGLNETPAFAARLYLYELGLTRPRSQARLFLERALSYSESEDASLAFAIYARYKDGDTEGLSRRLNALLGQDRARAFEALHALRMIYDSRPPGSAADPNQGVMILSGGVDKIESWVRSIAAASWQPRQRVQNERLGSEIIDSLLYGVTSTLLAIRHAMPALKPFQAHRAVEALYALSTEAHSLIMSCFAAFGSKSPEHRMLVLKELGARADVFLDPTVAEATKLQEIHKVLDFANKIRSMTIEQAAIMTTVLPTEQKGMSNIFVGGRQQEYTTSCGPTAMIVAATCYQPSLALSYHQDPRAFANAQREVMKEQGVRFRPRDIQEETDDNRERFAAQQNIDRLFEEQVDPHLNALVESGMLGSGQYRHIIYWRGYRGLRRKKTDGSMQDMVRCGINWGKLFDDLCHYVAARGLLLDPLIKDADALMKLIAMATPPKSARGTRLEDYAQALLGRASGRDHAMTNIPNDGNRQVTKSELLYNAAQQAALHSIVPFAIDYGPGGHAVLLVSAYPMSERDGTYNRDARAKELFLCHCRPGHGPRNDHFRRSFRGRPRYADSGSTGCSCQQDHLLHPAFGLAASGHRCLALTARPATIRRSKPHQSIFALPTVMLH